MKLRCVECDASSPGLDRARYRCEVCGGTLDVVRELQIGTPSAEVLDARLGSRLRWDRSGVWRFRELILPEVPVEALCAKPEGNTNLYDVPRLAAQVGLDALQLKHEGENPTGSFKDRGMTAGITVARQLGAEMVACASTGNTSASMAAYAAAFGMRAVVFVPEGKIAYGKLAQALAYGARTVQIGAGFDTAMGLVEQVCQTRPIYLLNSINPFRIEGQKAIGLEILQDRGWRVPDWIVLPGGNLGNNTALTRALVEALAVGLIDRLPRVAVIQAAGANPLHTAWRSGSDVVPVHAETLATAIRIGAPVSWRKSLRGLARVRGVVESVTDQEIVDAKAHVDAAGIGAEPASCATVAGIRKLVAAGTIARDADVVGILTGHLLKDPELTVAYHTGQLDGLHSTWANPPVKAEATLDGVLAAIGA